MINIVNSCAFKCIKDYLKKYIFLFFSFQDEKKILFLGGVHESSGGQGKCQTEHHFTPH